MRPSTLLLILICFIITTQLVMFNLQNRRYTEQVHDNQVMQRVIKRLGLTDLCVATDARYIRHLSISDPVAPFMDHPFAIEHFPSSAVIVPVR